MRKTRSNRGLPRPSRAVRIPKTIHRRTARGAVALLLWALGTPVGLANATSPVPCSSFAAGGPACGAEPIGSVSGGGHATRFVGNPIDVVTGNKYQHREDYRAFGSRLAFSRHYNTAQTDANLGLGRGWRHDYEVSLARTGEMGVRLFQSDGRQIDFEAVGVDVALEAGVDVDALSAGHVAYLPRDASDGHVLVGDVGARWLTTDGRELRFLGRYLVEVSWPDGDRLELGYDREGRLAAVTDRHDRALRFAYTPGRRGLDSWDPAHDVTLPGHLERVLLPDGSALEYRYDNRRNLVRVDHAGEEIERLTYDDRDWPNHLTGLDAAGGSRHWHYDDDGRGDGYADGLGSVLMLEHLPEPMDSSGVQVGRTLVRRLDGAYLDYRWSVDAGGRGEIDAVVEHGCATCVGVPRPERRHGDAVPGGGAASDGVPIAGLSIESLTADGAIVSADGLSGPVSVRFDRRGRPARIDSLSTGADGAAVRDVARLLDGVGTVDGSGVAYAARSKTNCPPPLFRTCEELAHDRELLVMSDCAYAPEGTACPKLDPAWVELTAADLGVDLELLHHDNYDARVWVNAGTGEMVVAFRGSDDAGDFEEDARQFNGMTTRSYRRAKKLSDALADQGFSVTYTGHSLGGGLATTAALSNGQEAVVFNSAALHPDVAGELGVPLDRANESILGIYVEGDLVTASQDRTWREDLPWARPDGSRENPAEEVSLPAPGRRYPLPPPPAGSPNTSAFPLLRNIRHHMRPALHESLGNVIDQQCGP